jgi:hypothetical protein
MHHVVRYKGEPSEESSERWRKRAQQQLQEKYGDVNQDQRFDCAKKRREAEVHPSAATGESATTTATIRAIRHFVLLKPRARGRHL